MSDDVNYDWRKKNSESNKVKGKVIITKIKGPDGGELSGVVESELEDTTYGSSTCANFSELQFTKEGVYTLSITHADREVEPIELTVSVDKEEESKQGQSKGSENDSKDGSRPIIAQIDKPTLYLPSIETTSGGDGSPAHEPTGVYPYFQYRELSIDLVNVLFFRLYHDGILPSMILTFRDPMNDFKNQGAPTDDSSIQLFLNPRTSNLKAIHMSFKITNIECDKKDDNKYTLYGVIDVSGLYISNNNSYTGTSFSALRSICKSLGLGFNSNINSTDDNTKWKNPNKSIYNFISDIIKKTYISDATFALCYIDYYYCFNFIDIEKELQRDISKDVGVETSTLPSKTNDNTEGIKNETINLILTTDPGSSNSCNYINKCIRKNDSTEKSINDGYSKILRYYDNNNNQFIEFEIDTITSDESKVLPAKGQKESNTFKNENVQSIYMGSCDIDNLHTNALLAETQNKINLLNLNKVAVICYLPNPNFNLYKFQKVRFEYVLSGKTISNPHLLDYKYTGDYLVADIEFYWKNSTLTQMIRLIRRDFGLTPEEEEEKKKKEDVEKNTNKSTDINPAPPVEKKPNEKYNIGEIYNLIDEDGNKYMIYIKELMDNGKEIKGILKRKF
jgi:hypothetical protein